ncbi:hypothetical protein HDE_07838 [Halotydeus destructor]|nr:hypothetical protein HDE_07838 [Halotydeus destructor]
MNPKTGSKMYHLAELIKEKNGFVNAENAMKDFSQTSMLMFNLIGNIDRGEKTLVTESLFWNLLWFREFCGLNPVKASEMIVSEPFDEGVLTYFFNKRLPADVIRYMDYHGRNAVEFSLITEAVKSLADYIISALLNNNFNTLRCFKKLKDNELYDLKFNDATLEPYRSTFQSFIWALSFSTLVLIARPIDLSICQFYSKETLYQEKSAQARPFDIQRFETSCQLPPSTAKSCQQ